MLDLGTVRPGSTIRIPFSSFDKDDGSSITMTNFAAADILVYKDGGTTERASTAGFTATTDFDGKTGKHLAIVDLADNTTAGFWSAGSEYLVALDAVTVDAVTVGGWIARFRIGYPGALLDTTIATLSSQTSFTLTAGPAEDDALNGLWAMIHDLASAVQCAPVEILDYTGSTRTVTLAAGATFTAAAGDNFSLMGVAALRPTVVGRKLDVSTGGEAGVDWANVGTPGATVALSATTVGTATTLTNDPSGVTTLLSRVGTPSNLGSGASVAANLVDIEAQTDDIGAAGAGLTALGDSRIANLDAAVSTRASASALSTVGSDVLTNGTVLSLIYDRLRGAVLAAGVIGSTGNSATALHLTGLTYGDDELNNCLLVVHDVSAGEYHARWISDWADTGDLATVATLPFTPENGVDEYWILATRQDVTGGSGLDAAGVRAAVGLASANLDTQLGTIDTVVDSILADTGTDGVVVAAGSKTGYAIGTGGISAVSFAAGAVDAAAIAVDAIGASELAAGAATEIATAVLDAATSAPIAANVKEVNDVTLAGDGNGTPWGPA